MALLATARRHAVLLGTLLCFGCSNDSSTGTFELALYDVPVPCQAGQDSCAVAEGGGVIATAASGTAFMSGKASRFKPDGLYLYFEIVRPDQSVAQVEVDVVAERGTYRMPEGGMLSYAEYAGEQLAFHSTAAAGHLELPTSLSAPDHAPCGCEDGLLELRFIDAGPDGVVGTADDLQRRLSRGRFGRHGGSFCRSPRLLEVTAERVEVSSAPDCAIPAPPPSSGETAVIDDVAIDDGVIDDGVVDDGVVDDGVVDDDDAEAAAGCSAETEVADEESGCGGEDVGSSDDEDTGCEGGATEADYAESGCEGDTSESAGAGDYGCSDAGGTADYGSACEGDALAARSAVPRRSKSRAGSMLLPFAMLAVFQRMLRRRRAR